MTITHHPPEGGPENLWAAVLRRTVQLLLKPAFSPSVPIEKQRQRLDHVTRLAPPPRWARFDVATLEHAQHRVCGEWVRDQRTTATRPGTLLYLHGGAYCLGSAATHRNLAAQLARRTGMAVFSLNYRLAPEHRFPAAVEGSLSACRALRQQGPLVLAGDSAGGGLALATAIALRDAGEPPPAALYLISPWADMRFVHVPPEPPGEAMLSTAWAQACAALLLQGQDAAHPWASPLVADLSRLPPVLIQAGTDELLHEQALRLHAALHAAGTAVRCEITPRRWHVFQGSAGQLPSADDALDRAAAFIGQALPLPRECEVLVLGAGMSGLCTAAQLKRQGRHDFVVIEKSAGLGGTWWDNRYPGAHVDVPSPLYAFSFAPNHRWSRRFAGAPEIAAYMQRVALKEAALGHMHFGRALRSARFEEALGRWHIELGDGTAISARFFVCSTGPLNQARWPSIPGLASFAGTKLHSAMWQANAPITGRRVAVVGTGSTASQLVPPLAEQAAALTVFQRTANWVLPRIDRPYFDLDRTLSRWLPGWHRGVRAFWYHLLEWGRRGFDEGTLARRGMLGTAAAHLKRQVGDAALREKLKPPYPLGCKRIIYSNDFYPALTRPNVRVETAPIECITPGGVRTTDGREHAADVLVCATGFDTTHLLSSLRVQGVGGQTLAEAWAEAPAAYRGVTVAGFPNLFLMLGPNTGTGHTSTLLYIEPQVRFALAAMQRVRERGARCIDVKPEVYAAHNQALQQRLAGSVWSQCRSWYRNDAGKIVALWPGFTAEYVRGLTQVRWEDYRLG